MPASQAQTPATDPAEPLDHDQLKAQLRAYALDVGFDVVGFGPPVIPAANQERYHNFVAQGHHGTMSWIEDRLDQRAEPTRLWDQVKSVMVVGQNYAPTDDPQAETFARLERPQLANISAYARGRDYHDLMKKRLKRIARHLVQDLVPGTQVKVFVDTAPVPEKALAQAAGIGWQGKHTNLVSADFGSYLFLGVMYLDLALPPDLSAPHPDQCGSCTACLDVCPTGAFPAPYQLDATKCIAYLNIEHQGAIDPALADAMCNRVFGCDDCIAVCPWNKFAHPTAEPKFAPRPQTETASLGDFDSYDDAQFREAFAGTPVKRLGWERFQRNLAIAKTNAEKTFEPTDV